MGKVGRVLLVGAGPGDPDLLTVKAYRALQSAEVVVFDRLVSREILDLTPPGAMKIDVGKRPSSHPVPQEEINSILIRLALGGRVVVRLKGGDPFIFGRGGEEALALATAGVPFEVIPGVTAAQGCAAAVKVPLSHRGVAHGVRYLTGHCRADMELDFDWEGLADQDTTLVVYMALANIAQIADGLMSRGRAAETPVMAVSRGTRPDQRVLVSTLAQIAADLSGAHLPSPTLFIIGEVVNLASQLHMVHDDATTDPMVAAE